MSNTDTEKDTVIDKELSGERLQSRKRERFTIGIAASAMNQSYIDMS